MANDWRYESKRDKRNAILAIIFFLLALGIAGWLENQEFDELCSTQNNSKKVVDS